MLNSNFSNIAFANSLSSLASDFAYATQSAAIAAYKMIGKGDEKMADAVAVEFMRAGLNQINIEGEIVIGEGERDEAPMLYIGEKVGRGGEKIDIALDPLEGTTICATGAPGSLAVLAAAKKGDLLNAPDIYMDKIAIGPNLPENIIDLDNSPKVNLQNLALAKKCDISDLLVIILNRPRHSELIALTREAGARVNLISDGDIAAVMATAFGDGAADIYMGIGGAPEGVLGAAALATVGGQMMGRLVATKEEELLRAKKMNSDLSKKYTIKDMVKGPSLFCASGVTDGKLLKGVSYKNQTLSVETLILDSHLRKIEKINSSYRI